MLGKRQRETQGEGGKRQRGESEHANAKKRFFEENNIDDCISKFCKLKKIPGKDKWEVKWKFPCSVQLVHGGAVEEMCCFCGKWTNDKEEEEVIYGFYGIEFDDRKWRGDFLVNTCKTWKTQYYFHTTKTKDGEDIDDAKPLSMVPSCKPCLKSRTIYFPGGFQNPNTGQTLLGIPYRIYCTTPFY
jgi:hypothetical protein